MGVVARAALDEAVSPLGHQRCGSGEVAIAANHIVARGTGEDDVIDVLAGEGAQCGLILSRPEEDGWFVVGISGDPDAVFAGGERCEPTRRRG